MRSMLYKLRTSLHGLAILDSGCSRTMQGTKWAASFEAELEKMNVKPQALAVPLSARL